MIEVQRLNQEVVFINPDLLRLIERTPDTLLTFTDGQKLMVRNSPDEIIEKIVRFRHSCGIFNNTSAAAADFVDTNGG